MGVGSLAGVTYLRYTVLTSSNKSKTAVHFCDPALSVLVMLVSRNVFHVVSALQSFAFIHILFWLIRSLVDPTLAVLIVCGRLQLFSFPYKHDGGLHVIPFWVLKAFFVSLSVFSLKRSTAGAYAVSFSYRVLSQNKMTACT